MIDMTAIAWYAAICGALAALAPTLGGASRRIIVGAIIGILAATVLPWFRSMMGY